MSQKPTYLICQAIVAVNKAANLKWHHETKHSEFVANFPIGSEARKNKFQGLARVVWPLRKKHLSSPDLTCTWIDKLGELDLFVSPYFNDCCN